VAKRTFPAVSIHKQLNGPLAKRILYPAAGKLAAAVATSMKLIEISVMLGLTAATTII